MLPYKHFTLNERKCLQEFLNQGYSMRKIAEFLGRNVSSVSREINRNKSKYPTKKKSNNKYRYNAWRAQTLTIIRRREKKSFRLKEDSNEWNYIVEKLKKFWSPEEISERWKMEHPGQKGFGTSTIYRYINKGKFAGISSKTNLRRHGKRMFPRKANYNSIQPDLIIPDWPDEIRSRARIGDWKGDTIYGGIGKGLLVTLVERKSRFLIAGLLENRNASMTKDVIVKLLEKVDDVDYVVDLINNRPGKCLGWLSPAEFFSLHSVALT